MKTRLAVALVGLRISFAVLSFAQEKDTVYPQIAEQIRALTIKYDEAFNRNDAAAVAALFSEDGVLSEPHGRLRRLPARILMMIIFCGSNPLWAQLSELHLNRGPFRSTGRQLALGDDPPQECIRGNRVPV